MFPDNFFRRLVAYSLIIQLAAVPLAWSAWELMGSVWRHLPHWMGMQLLAANQILLAIWAGISPQRAPLRIVGLVFGTGLLGMLQVVYQIMMFRAYSIGSFGMWPGYLFIAGHGIFSVIFVALGLRICRRWLGVLVKFPVNDDDLRPGPAQISIRGIMGFTFGAAILLAIHRFTQDALRAWGLAVVILPNMLNTILLSILSVWSTLDRPAPLFRIAIVMTVSAGSAAGLASLYFPSDKLPGIVLAFRVLETVLPFSIVLGCLLLVRWRGYRLVRADRTPPPPAASDPAEPAVSNNHA